MSRNQLRRARIGRAGRRKKRQNHNVAGASARVKAKTMPMLARGDPPARSG
jgi:hypothetical protein